MGLNSDFEKEKIFLTQVRKNKKKNKIQVNNRK